MHENVFRAPLDILAAMLEAMSINSYRISSHWSTTITERASKRARREQNIKQIKNYQNNHIEIEIEIEMTMMSV